jgi:hypothetical protein
LLPEPAPQSAHALPVEERDQQIGDVLDVIISQMFPHSLAAHCECSPLELEQDRARLS